MRVNLAVSFEALVRHRVRTTLSTLGVVCGVAAVVAMISVTEGARAESLRQMSALGLANVIVRERALTALELQQRRSTGLTVGDANALRMLVPGVRHTASVVHRAMTVLGPGDSAVAAVLGVTTGFSVVLDFQAARGRLLTTLDDQTAARVCVLGSRLGKTLLGGAPLPHPVRIGGEWFAAVGVLNDRADSPRDSAPLPGRDLNVSVLVPLSAIRGSRVEAPASAHIDEIWLAFGDVNRVRRGARVVEDVMAGLHRGSPDFDVVVPRELLNQRYRVQRTFSVVVGSVALLSLLIGGIGIMNVMLASVLERTAEIGIRRAVGATRRHVLTQFLAETLIVTIGGGCAGIMAGMAAAWGIARYASWPTHVSIVAVLCALAVSICVGLIFGAYPALRAARLDPIAAVHVE